MKPDECASVPTAAKDMLKMVGQFKTDADAYSPLGLAWLGDAVFELLVRSAVVSAGNAPADTLFRAAKKYSSAAAQSAYYSLLEPNLTDEEKAVLKRGRNAKSYGKAKNAGIVDYRRATGVEALFGYLLLKGNVDRLSELFELILRGTAAN